CRLRLYRRRKPGCLCHPRQWRKATPPDHRFGGRRRSKLVERREMGVLCIEENWSSGGVESISRRRGGWAGDPEWRRTSPRVTRWQGHLLHESILRLIRSLEDTPEWWRGESGAPICERARFFSGQRGDLFHSRAGRRS